MGNNGSCSLACTKVYCVRPRYQSSTGSLVLMNVPAGEDWFCLIPPERRGEQALKNVTSINRALYSPIDGFKAQYNAGFRGCAVCTQCLRNSAYSGDCGFSLHRFLVVELDSFDVGNVLSISLNGIRIRALVASALRGVARRHVDAC